MNKEKFKQLINKPNAVSKKQTLALAQLLEEFPYFQMARVLHLKGLKNQKSYLYNNALKKTAAFTTNRTVLFDFITTNNLDYNSVLKSQKDTLNEIEVIDSKVINQLYDSIKTFENKAVLKTKNDKEENNIKETSNQKEIDNLKKEIQEIKNELSENKEILNIGEPLHFNQNDSFSFNEWLQLDVKKPIKRENVLKNIDNNKKNALKTQQKQDQNTDLIQQFIKNKPKIKPLKNDVITDVSKQSSQENTNLMTETLARVYLEQKKYKKAITAFKILSLKYPEKSSFFADRIKAIKFLENHKS